MPMDDGPPTPALVLWVSRRVVRQHSGAAGGRWVDGRCRQCAADGCHLLDWARGNLKAHRQAGNRPDRYQRRTM
nr:hypothetical protein [Micromonospora sp. DSM 115978]